jgi:hypothetical protein
MLFGLASGDENTKFFNHFTNHRKNHNTIWDLKSLEGQTIKGFKDLVELGVHCCSNIFKERETTNISEIV